MNKITFLYHTGEKAIFVVRDTHFMIMNKIEHATETKTLVSLSVPLENEEDGLLFVSLDKILRILVEESKESEE